MYLASLLLDLFMFACVNEVSYIIETLTLWCKRPWWARPSSLWKIHDHRQWHAPQSMGLLWRSEQPETETSTWLQTTLIRDNIHVSGGIQTRNPSKQAVADPHLRQLDHLFRPQLKAVGVFYGSYYEYAAFSQSSTLKKKRSHFFPTEHFFSPTNGEFQHFWGVSVNEPLRLNVAFLNGHSVFISQCV